MPRPLGRASVAALLILWSGFGVTLGFLHGGSISKGLGLGAGGPALIRGIHSPARRLPGRQLYSSVAPRVESQATTPNPVPPAVIILSPEARAAFNATLTAAASVTAVSPKLMNPIGHEDHHVEAIPDDVHFSSMAHEKMGPMDEVSFFTCK